MTRARPEPFAGEERLDSWKEIASYLGRGVRTVQRWERLENLPVRRHAHEKRGTVFALRAEIDQWLSERQNADFLRDDSEPPPDRVRAKWAAVVVGGIAAIAAAYAVTRPAPEPASSDWTLRPLTADRGHEHTPELSPDGELLVYAWHDGMLERPQLYLQPVDGGPRQRLTTEDQMEIAPAWSPDGREIAVVTMTPDRKKAIALISPDTGVQRAIIEPTTVVGPAGALAWTPDSGYLLMAVALERGRPSLLAYRVEDGRVHAVLNSEKYLWPGTPAVSPTGDQIAFTSQISDSVSEIFVLDVDAYLQPLGEPRQVTNQGDATSPVFSHDGSELIYRAGSWTSKSLWRVSVDGGRPRRATPAADGVEHFAYRPDTGRLVFSRIDVVIDIWKQPICDCKPERERLIESTRTDVNMRCSPNGEKIAFASNRTGRFEIWTADMDGSNPRQVTDIDGTMTGTPRWSPDSRLLAFDSRLDGQSDIFVVDASGGEPVRLTEGPSADVTPNWSSDGRWIYFGSDREGPFEIWKVPSSGGEAVQVTDGGGYTAEEARDGQTLYFARRAPYHETLEEDTEAPAYPGTSLWRMPVAGGEPKLVAASINDWSKFVPTAGGVIYVSCKADDGCAIWRYDATEDRSGTVGQAPGELEVGFDVTADGKSILYSTVESGDGDLMLVEGFR